MSSSLQRSVLLGGREEPAGSDSMSESGASAGGGCGGGGGGAAGGSGGGGGGGGSRDGEFLQHAAAVLGLPLGDMFADRVRVDRRRLEGLITGESESKETAQEFFDRLEEQTRTRILWPSHLKIGSRSRKSPHVHIAGLMEDVLLAKKEVMAVLDSPDVRVTMKIDVSYLYHSHIIGRGGLVIKQVMEETGTHIHFPDSNRTSTTDKSSQVSLSGKLAGVEQARQRVRNLMPLVFMFDVPALGDAATGAECASPYVMRLQQQFNVQVRVRHRHRLNGVQVQVKGSELEVPRVTEATLFLIRHFCVNAGAADQVSVYTTLEIPPHHQPLVLGINCSNIKTIMNHTSTQIMVPDLNDPYIPQIKKNIITVLGPIKNVYMARQMLLGSLPILLLFEISDNTTVDFNNVAEVMYDLDVQISFRQKEKQKTFAVSIKGIERDASNVYEARRRILGLEGHRVVAEVPITYHIPNAPPVFRHALGRGRGVAGAGALPGPGPVVADRRRAPSPDEESEALLGERWESPYEQLTRNVSAVLRRQAAAAAAAAAAASSASTAGSVAPSRSTTPASGTGSAALATPAPGAAAGATGLRGSQSSLLSVATWLSSSSFAPNQQRPDSGYAASSSAASSLAPSPFPGSGRTSPSSVSAASTSPLASPGSTAAAAAAAAPSSTAVTTSATPTATATSAPSPSPTSAALTPGSGSVSDEAFGSPLGAEDLADPSPASVGFLAGSVSEFPDMVQCPDRRAPGYEKAKSRELAAAAATAAAATASDYRRQLALAFKAMQEPPVASQPRVPTSAWSGMGFSRSSPISSPAPASPPRTNASIAAAAAEAQSLWRSSPGPLALRLPQTGAPPLWGGHEAPWPPDTTTPNHPTPADVVELLTSLGLHKYIDLFQREEIDLQAFRALTEMDLLEIGITAVGARRKMLSAISALEAGRLFYGQGGPTSEQMVPSDSDSLTTTPNLYNR